MSETASRNLSLHTYKPFLFWFGLGSLVWITLLLYAGGFTTTIRAGMAFLDWPWSRGSINPEGWTQNKDELAEHSHRLLGMVMGILMIISFAACKKLRVPRFVERTAFWLLILVIVQGLLGGLRVLLDELNVNFDNNLIAQSFAVAHGTFAQLYLCILVSFVAINSRSWIERNAGFQGRAASSTALLGKVACITIVLQLLVGAIMRQAEAGLAIVTFPLTPHGTLIPVRFDHLVTIHFAHRVGAVIVTIALLAFCIRIWTDPESRKAVGKSAWAIVGLLVFQIFLGAQVIWTLKNEHITTIHVLNGAITLAVTWLTTFRILKSRIAKMTVISSEVDSSEKTELAGSASHA